MTESVTSSTPGESPSGEILAPRSVELEPATKSTAVGQEKSARPLQDLAVILVALLVVMLPGWLRGIPGARARIEIRAVEPIRIEVNSAPWYHWTLLGGIGESRARAIVEYRRAHGPFLSVDDLLNVPRMPSGWVDRAREQLVCERR